MRTEPTCSICGSDAVAKVYEVNARPMTLWVCPHGHGVITRDYAGQGPQTGGRRVASAK